MNKYLVYIYIPIALGLDFYSTYWSSSGDINSIIELHFLSSIFGKGFESLSIAFLIESFILLFLYKFYLSKKELYSLKKASAPKYKILKVHNRKKIFDAEQFIDAIPVIVFIISTSHLIFSFNNFLLGFYLRGANSKLVNDYINYVHVGGRIYLLHISIVIIATMVIYYFSKGRKVKYNL